MIPIVSIIGRSNSGKTTVIEKLVDYFQRKNYKISIIKHTHHEFNIDIPEKDSFRYKDAGASSVFIASENKIAMVSDVGKPLSPSDIASQYLSKDYDLIIVEGFKELDLPKIEVIGDSHESSLLTSGITNINAIITDLSIESDLPQFRRDNIDMIGKFIEENFIRTL